MSKWSGTKLFKRFNTRRQRKLSDSCRKCLGFREWIAAGCNFQLKQEFRSFASLFHLQTIGADYAVCCGNYLCFILLHSSEEEIFAQCSVRGASKNAKTAWQSILVDKALDKLRASRLYFASAQHVPSKLILRLLGNANTSPGIWSNSA